MQYPPDIGWNSREQLFNNQITIINRSPKTKVTEIKKKKKLYDLIKTDYYRSE